MKIPGNMLDGWGPFITIVCTGGKKKPHEKKTLGVVARGGIVVTIGGAHDKRRRTATGGIDPHPEQCPECRFTPRLSRDGWQRLVAGYLADGRTEVDVSVLKKLL